MTSTVDSLLLPMQQRPLLIPVDCLADVIDYSRPTKTNNDEDWYLGKIDWRGQSIPLITFERANQGRFAEFSATARIAVMHSATGNEQLPFYGMVVQGVPQNISVSEENITASDDQPRPAETLRVTVREMAMAIPDLARLEQMLTD
ncbi:hypothetical protein EOPP23_00910 [Endozoicomonas sp. OPT23]|uniref:chemotaxis protein CheW n=1 Tax=Endozoicomonas sp. OPT23 TaxID=2072845 RepID=UPI00129BCC90|nr:chemotaxis protein CheW [Endozoicomonas sp. OPT23]MRI31551.1 hypothetical protein [Endozoicomonas sp. OPT23]